MNSIRKFSTVSFTEALKAFFSELNVPVNYLADNPASAADILADKYKSTNESHQLIEDVYAFGMVNDAIFEGRENAISDLADIKQLDADYDGLLIFGVILKDRSDGLLPTRGQLADITRSFNQVFPYTPVTIVFKYGSHISFANSERIKFKQEWREGEKVGKVSLLRDISIENTHSGHIRILLELKISATDKNKINSFNSLYAYWQQVFNVSLLNKKFYQELSYWYFWAIKNVTFPGVPTAEDAFRKNKDLDDLEQEHKATNVIRMLTRLLFVWFIKEKKLIPESLFELETLQKDILNEISPYHETGMFKQANKDSVYYKAILQNLFFATLNCPINADSLDKRKREFRGDGYGQHRGIDYLLRYKQYFKNPDAFLEMLNKQVPFLNGGLFECLDDKDNNLYIDGFSDQMTKGEQLIVPDYLFFGVEEKIDLSAEFGVTNKKGTNDAAVKGLINILKSYKFTITENTPIEEDVALDPELLGKVFENLLASYNPETKTTARKQTGSFYTPREIVNYMVDESLIAYLKPQLLAESPAWVQFGNTQTDMFGNKERSQLKLEHTIGLSNWKGREDELETKLRNLVSYNNDLNPFTNKEDAKQLLYAIDNCKILDPACGSGAFPMGVLQKMVHILQKLDPGNAVWKEVQISKAKNEAEQAFAIEDKEAREERLIEINNAFDQSINDPDYARKLFLIENCIYGVDIQPIATQISKLRFFISLVVEQKVNTNKDNFGIRPLPNLETKFVAANSLVGIEKEQYQNSLFDTKEVKLLEVELKKIRSKLFSAKSKDTKIKYRKQDEELRKAIATELEKIGWKNKTALMLAAWDPYNQNTSSPFFDIEWMFDMKDGFDIVIGNPPYGGGYSDTEKKYFKSFYKSAQTIPKIQKGSLDTFTLFIEQSFNSLRKNGSLNYIVPIAITSSDSMTGIQNLLESNCNEIKISSYSVRPQPVFQNAVVNTSILFFTKSGTPCTKILSTKMYRKNKDFNLQYLVDNLQFIDVFNYRLIGRYPKISLEIERNILGKVFLQKTSIGDLIKLIGKPIYYRTTGGRYYKVITPYSTGSTKETSIYFDEKISKSIGAILSSSLYFWFYQIYSNNLDLKFYEIASFKIPLEKLTDYSIVKLENLYSEYLKDIEANSNVRQTTKYANIDSFREYKIGKSKHIIDKIDDLICPLFGFNQEETDFIKNYEIDFRLTDEEYTAPEDVVENDGSAKNEKVKPKGKNGGGKKGFDIPIMDI